MTDATRRWPPVGFLAVAAGLVLSLWMLRQALLPFFVAIVAAYLLSPLVARLARHWGRAWAVLTVVLGALLAGGATLAWFVPFLWGQVERLVASLPAIRTTLAQRLAPWLQSHPAIQAKVQDALAGVDPMALLNGLRVAGQGVLGAFLGLMAFVLVPLIVYYLLLEGPRLVAGVDGLVPPRHRDLARHLAREVHQRMGGYVRGQLAVALAMSLLQGVGFAVLGVPYAWLLGLVAGLSNAIPYSPYVTALPVALVLAGLQGFTWGKLAGVALLFIGIQKAEAFYFTPVWVGRATKLHPLEVLLALLSFGSAFGVLGLVLAVPLMILVKVAAEHLLEDYRRHPWFTREAA